MVGHVRSNEDDDPPANSLPTRSTTWCLAARLRIMDWQLLLPILPFGTKSLLAASWNFVSRYLASSAMAAAPLIMKGGSTRRQCRFVADWDDDGGSSRKGMGRRVLGMLLGCFGVQSH